MTYVVDYQIEDDNKVLPEIFQAMVTWVSASGTTLTPFQAWYAGMQEAHGQSFKVLNVIEVREL